MIHVLSLLGNQELVTTWTLNAGREFPVSVSAVSDTRDLHCSCHCWHSSPRARDDWHCAGVPARQAGLGIQWS
jgi:hypothetical protein